MEHVKYYKDIRVPIDTLVKKRISYANATVDEKYIIVVSGSPFIKIKEEKINIKPFSSGEIKLRMYFDRGCSVN